MEKLDGMTVGDIWFALSFKERYKVVGQMVQLEKKALFTATPGKWEHLLPA